MTKDNIIALIGVVIAAFVAITTLVLGVLELRDDRCRTGYYYSEGECVDQLKSQVGQILSDVQRTLGQQSNELLPLFMVFTEEPTEQNWTDIQDLAIKLHDQVDAGLQEIIKYDSQIFTLDGGVIRISNGNSTIIDDKYSDVFSKIRNEWNDRRAVTRDIFGQDEMPTIEQAEDWIADIDAMNQSLASELLDILELLYDVSDMLSRPN